MSIKVLTPTKLVVNTVPIPFTTMSLNPGFTEFLQQNGVQVDPTYVGIDSIAPMISADSLALDLLISSLGFSGVTLTAFEMWFAEVPAGAVVALPDTAVKISGTTGVGIMTNFSASGGESPSPASGGLELHALGDADNAPLTVLSAQAVPSPATLAAIYYLSTVTFNGVDYDPTQVTVDMGLEIAKRVSAGTAWPTYAGVPRRAAQISVSTENMVSLKDLTDADDGIGGKLVSDVILYFRHALNGIARSANIVEQHISIAAPSAMITPGSGGGPIDGFATQEISIRPMSVSGNASLVFADDIAIP